MANKRKQNIDIPLYLAIGLGLLAATMIFVKAFIGEMVFNDVINARDKVISGIHASCGFAENGIKAFSMNFLSMIAYILPLLTAVTLLLFNDKKIVNISCLILFAISGICAFLAILILPNTIVNQTYTMYDFRLGIGSILSGIFSLLASLSLAFKLLKK